MNKWVSLGKSDGEGCAGEKETKTEAESDDGVKD